AAPAARGGRIGIGTLLGVMLFSMAGAGGAAWFVMGKSRAEGAAPTHDAEAAPGGVPAPASYLAMDPAFIVNRESPDEPRYLQAEGQLMTRAALALDAAKAHLPLLRNSLLLLLGQQRPEGLVTRAGKERLQQRALAEVQRVLKAETGKPQVDAVYFT